MEANILLNFNLKNYKPIIDDLIKSSKFNNSIYSGKAGAIIYLIEIFEITQNYDFLIEAENLAQVIYNEVKDKESSSFAFYTGNMGVSYVFLMLYKVTQKNYFLDYSIHIAKKSKNHLALQKKPIIDLINGVSGVLLGLLHLHQAGVNDEWLIEDIKFYVDYIISKSELDINEGIFWDRTNKINKGLTGFSHGASGIGFVFNELYKITEIEGFKQLCLQTFLYEDGNYDKGKKNWLDFRMFPFSESEYLEFDYQTKKEYVDFYVKPKFMNAWCHGAPGILLSRHNLGFANENVKDSKKEVINSLNNLSNHSLCHSGIGNALCLLSVDDGAAYKDDLNNLCSTLIDYFQKNKVFISGYNDKSFYKSLMMGDLGVMYFMLKIYKFIKNGKIDNNVLYPTVISNGEKSYMLNKTFSNYNFDYISKMIIRNHYPKTLSLIEKQQIEIVILKEKIEQSFIKEMDKIDNILIKDVFIYERKIRKAMNEGTSYSYNYYRNKIDIDLVTKENININELLVFVSPRLNIIKTQWNWDGLTNPKWNLNHISIRQESEFLIISNWDVRVLKSNNFISQLLEYLEKTPSIKIFEIVEYFTNIISIDDAQKNEAKELILNNIIRLIKIGAINILHEKI